MKKRLISGIIISLSIGFSHGQLISDSEEIDNFDVNSAVSNINDLKWSVESITKELFALDDKERDNGSGSISDKYRETRNEIVSIINNINTTTEKVNTLLRQVSAYKKEIINARDEIKDSQTGAVITKQYMSDFINFIYKLDNKLYNQTDNKIDDIKLIINSDNIPRTIANDYMIQSMIVQLNNLISNLYANEEDQLDSIKKYNKLKVQAQNDLLEYETDLEKLQQKKNYLVQFLWLYKKDKLARQQTITELFESTKWVHDKIQDLLKDVKKWIYKVDFSINKKLKELENIDNDSEAYPLAWPIYPIYDIETYFWDINFQKQYGIPSLGIQIKATQGVPVYAARDGIVYYSIDNDNIGINRTMLMHTDGYVSVYEYLNRTVVKAGDIVRRGQLIGYSGGEPGTRGAGFISKGPNLSFMIFKDAVALDPFDILDASIVKDKSVLPDGYQIKYLRDKYARPIDITALTLMTGETLAEREYQFLKLYGVGVYKNSQFREDATKGTNIDKDVVICIAFAESTLGRYLTTSNNIGNVGNNDRGDRVAINGVLAGARAIPLTLNNAYLGNYHTIKQLSRYGNKDGKIYASSPINWQTNVLKCLSQIKGYYIPEDFPFRVWPNPNKSGSGEYISADILKKIATKKDL